MFIYGREENARVGILVHIEDKDKNLLLTTFSTNKTPVPGSAFLPSRTTRFYIDIYLQLTASSFLYSPPVFWHTRKRFFFYSRCVEIKMMNLKQNGFNF